MRTWAVKFWQKSLNSLRGFRGSSCLSCWHEPGEQWCSAGPRNSQRRKIAEKIQLQKVFKISLGVKLSLMKVKLICLWRNPLSNRFIVTQEPPCSIQCASPNATDCPVVTSGVVRPLPSANPQYHRKLQCLSWKINAVVLPSLVLLVRELL